MGIIYLPQLVGHDIKRDDEEWFCMTCEMPVCGKCKAHADYRERDGHGEWFCKAHGFITYSQEP